MQDAAWNYSTHEPADWNTWLRACGGGIMQAPLSLFIGQALGTPVYWALGTPGAAPVGIALSMNTRCRFSRRARHVRFASLPAFAPGVDRGLALDSLRAAANAADAAEVSFESYDATFVPAQGVNRRLEYVLALSPEEDSFAKLSANHRRYVRRGDREEWTLRMMAGEPARDAVTTAHDSTAKRAASLAREFERSTATSWQDHLTVAMPLPPAGLSVFAAYSGDLLLSSILVGWAGGRAYYHTGGSTEEGFRRSSAAWLHMRVIRLMSEQGITSYNFGGTPPDAAEPKSPSHGLHRFKTGFGAEPTERLGLHWTCDRWHMALHEAWDRVSRQ